MFLHKFAGLLNYLGENEQIRLAKNLLGKYFHEMFSVPYLYYNLGLIEVKINLEKIPC